MDADGSFSTNEKQVEAVQIDFTEGAAPATSDTKPSDVSKSRFSNFGKVFSRKPSCINGVKVKDIKTSIKKLNKENIKSLSLEDAKNLESLLSQIQEKSTPKVAKRIFGWKKPSKINQKSIENALAIVKPHIENIEKVYAKINKINREFDAKLSDIKEGDSLLDLDITGLEKSLTEEILELPQENKEKAEEAIKTQIYDFNKIILNKGLVEIVESFSERLNKGLVEIVESFSERLNKGEDVFSLEKEFKAKNSSLEERKEKLESFDLMELRLKINLLNSEISKKKKNLDPNYKEKKKNREEVVSKWEALKAKEKEESSLKDAGLLTIVRDNKVVYSKEEITKKLAKAKKEAISQKEVLKDNRAIAGEKISETVNPTLEDATAVAHALGGRESQEDTHKVGKIQFNLGGKQVDASFQAVFDGHGGSGASQFCAEHIQEFLLESIESQVKKHADSDVAIWNALKLVFVDLDLAYVGTEDGTTANLTLRIGQDLWVVNSGDSRAVLVDDKGEATSLSQDMKPNDEIFKKGVNKRGGWVMMSRVFLKSESTNLTDIREIPKNLAVPRAIGDHNFGGVFSARGKVVKHTLPEDATGYHLVQCCDGIFDVMKSQDVGNILKNEKSKENFSKTCAKEIIEKAYFKGSRDNLTAMVTTL